MKIGELPPHVVTRVKSKLESETCNINEGKKFGLKKFLKLVTKVLIVPFIVIFLLDLLGLPNFFIEGLISIWMALVYGVTLFVLFNIKSSKKSGKFKGSLYEWMEELNDNDENLTSQLKRMDTRYQTIENLSAIKDLIMKSTEGSIEKLKLYKAFYRLSLKESTEEIYYKIIIGLITSIGIFVIRDQVSKLEEYNYSNLFFIGLIIIFSILAIVGVINENKKRTGLIIEILDICINQLEDTKLKDEQESTL